MVSSEWRVRRICLPFPVWVYLFYKKGGSRTAPTKVGGQFKNGYLSSPSLVIYLHLSMRERAGCGCPAFKNCSNDSQTVRAAYSSLNKPRSHNFCTCSNGVAAAAKAARSFANSTHTRVS